MHLLRGKWFGPSAATESVDRSSIPYTLLERCSATSRAKNPTRMQFRGRNGLLCGTLDGLMALLVTGQ